MSSEPLPTCYRHPGRDTRVSCSNCGRPICPDCMTPTPVGMRCPECTRQKTKVTTMPTVRARADATNVTIALIAINALLYLASGRFGVGSAGGGSRLYTDLALFGPAVHDGEWWRLVSGGFLHAGLLHIGFNMYLLWILGKMLEPVLGQVRFAVLYATALLGGSFGALLLTPDAFTVGASGAVFGLMGAAAVELHSRGINPLKTDIGTLIILNLGLSFVLSGISIGGHLGGLGAGILAGFAFRLADDRRTPLIGYAGCVLIAAAAVAGAFAVV